MFCIQCEQTLSNKKVKGCAFASGMCGKTSEVSNLQDVLIYALQSVSFWAEQGRKHQIIDQEVDQWVPKAFFATLTNVNFDPERIIALANQAELYIQQLKSKVLAANIKLDQQTLPKVSQFVLPTTTAEILALAPQFAINRGKEEVSEDVIGLRMLCLYGLKGAAAYIEHARVLDAQDNKIHEQFHKIMAWLATDPTDLSALLDCSMEIGMLNFNVMEMLDTASNHYFGAPTPTKVNTKPVKGKCILVSGHDLKDLELILQQTQGKGINVYTNGEMLPAHGYPSLNKYPHLVGNFGGAWYQQQQEFARFPGAIVMTSNCLIDPKPGQYSERLFTRSIVGWPGVTHIEGDDFTAVIDCALACEGFAHDEIEHEILVGFGREALMSAAPAVVEQIKAGNIKHFFLVGGCDGEKESRSYYSDFVTHAPKDSVILTLGCAKFRFNQYDFGNINGIPRLLDIGQCNDAYSAIMLAVALSKEFNCDINELPLTLVLSWFEQKAIVILLTLFALGVKGIYTGPSAPAFLTDNLLAIIEEKFQMKSIGQAETDLDTILTA